MMRWMFEVNVNGANLKLEVLANKLPTAMRDVGKEVMLHLAKAGSYNAGFTLKLVSGEPVSKVKKPPIEAPPPPEGAVLPPAPTPGATGGDPKV